MEQADVPAVAHAGQETHQRARFFRKLEAIENFVFRTRRMAADHVAHMQLGQFVVAQVQRLQPAAAQRPDQLLCFLAVAHLHADKHPCLLRIVKTIIELGDIARTQQFAERLEAAGLLGNGHREYGFTVFADFGFFRDKAQPVEIHVGAAGHRHQGGIADLAPRNPRFRAGDGQRPGGLENGAGIFEHVLDRRAHRIGVDADDFIDQRAAQAKGFTAHLFHCDAVSEQADLSQLDAATGLDRLVHRV